MVWVYGHLVKQCTKDSNQLSCGCMIERFGLV
nr:MAG TPA: hypothetical protein [Caudoviricetes sp.]